MTEDIDNKNSSPRSELICFVVHKAFKCLYALSPFSQWILDDYCERYGIRHIFRLTAMMHFMAQNFTHQLSDIFLTHYSLIKVMEEVKKEGTFVTIEEVCKLWK